MKTFKSLTLGFLAANLASYSVSAETKNALIKCVSDTGEEVSLELWEPSSFGEPLHCIRGDFVADLTPCAPDGGWGLSRGTGTAGLAEITRSWQVASSHSSGKVSSFVGAEDIRFAASYGEGLPSHSDDSTNEWWFIVSRISGLATLNISGDKSTNFECTKIDRKF